MFLKPFLPLFIIIVSFASFEATRKSFQRMVGALPAENGEFPYIVSLRKRGRNFCGGSIIGPRHILTAAHCIDKKINNNVTVLVGSNTLSKGGKAFFIQKVVMHPDYKKGKNSSWHNDIGVITLMNSLDSGNLYWKSIKLASQDYEPGTLAVTAGWGRHDIKNLTSSDKLMKINTKLADFCTCRKQSRVQLYTEQLCTIPKKRRGFCKGDSGCPLVVNDEVVGIVSFTRSCAKGYPEIYTKVRSYRDFIIKEVKRKIVKI